VSKEDPPTNVSKSICEAALERYSKLDDSLAELIRQASIEVRDFMLLSFVCDQGTMSIDQISRALGLSRESTQHCVDRLIMAQLVYYNSNDDAPNGRHGISATTAGRRVTRRIHSGGE
jgi:DNA-binding MarR family transcriptional regulator